MPTVADVLRRYGGEYLERFGPRLPAEHRKVLHAISACRTGQLGTVFYACSSCGRRHAMGRSCGNRHCPTCQQHKTRAWLEKQTARLLPCPYFLLTFTLPAGLRPLVRAHQRVCYAALFEASSQAIKLLAADPKYVGTSSPGFFGVLHTWGRTLEYHPHVHYVVPGGGLSDDGSQWLPSRADFFVPVKALSKILQHVLPAGFQKVRHYGFASPGAKQPFEAVRWLVTLHAGLLFVLATQEMLAGIARPPLRCPECGGALCVIGFARAYVPDFDTS